MEMSDVVDQLENKVVKLLRFKNTQEYKNYTESQKKKHLALIVEIMDSLDEYENT
jgi:hypothetical protein